MNLSKLNKRIPCPAGAKSRLTLGIAVSVALLFSFSDPVSASLQQIAKLPQWPGVSQLIAYQDRIWFVNSEPYEDTNVADIYSHVPGTTSLDYERSLFSQDAGNPVVYKGLLFWPFEDPRSSAGSGEYAVTDGTDWAWRIMQSGSVMHVHAMGVCDDHLVALTGSWNGQLHRLDANDIWQLQFEYPAGAAPFSRLVSFDQFNGHCLVGASANGQNEPKLLRFEGNTHIPVSSWPASDRVEEITVHKTSLFAFADSATGRELLHFDGEKTKVIKHPDGHRPRGLHSDGETLWLITGKSQEKNDAGGLWTVDDNGDITRVAAFSDTPIDLTGYQNQLFIGTYSGEGGALWSYTIADSKVKEQLTDRSSIRLPQSDNSQPLDEKLVQTLFQELLELVENPQNSASFARGLRRQISRHPDGAKPEFGEAVTRLLSEELEGESVTMFTEETISWQSLVHWYLISALARNGHGLLKPSFINSGQRISDQFSGKVFNPMVAAIVAVGWLGQDDPATISALMKRLNHDSDPAWLKADLIGALTATTKMTFGYDIDAWNVWWQTQQ